MNEITTPSYDNAGKLRLLAGLDVFRHCPHRALRGLLPNTDFVEVAAGTRLASAGASAAEFLGIIGGYVEAVDSGESVLLGPGDQIGGRELVEHRVHGATYITLTPVLLLAVFGPAFRWSMRELPAAAAALRRALSNHSAAICAASRREARAMNHSSLLADTFRLEHNERVRHAELSAVLRQSSSLTDRSRSTTHPVAQFANAVRALPDHFRRRRSANGESRLPALRAE